jgi:DNA-binding transcriptional regulator YhcF (GntR family)
MARTPLYKAAETEMIRRIESGEWEVGKRLPNEFVLAEEFKVSQGTMRRALMTLEGMGLLNRKPGRGTLVARPAPAASGRQRRHSSCRAGAGRVRGAPGEIGPARRRCRRGGAVRHRPPVPCGTAAETRRRARGIEDIAIPESIAPAFWTRTPRWILVGLPGRPWGRRRISPKPSAPTSRRCRNPYRCPATGTRRFWWSRARPGTKTASPSPARFCA